MESLRHQLLQAELTRIEQEAKAKSYAIMNKADALATAHTFCEQINEGLQAFYKFHVAVNYSIPPGCEIVIYTHDDGDVFLRRATELGMKWEVVGTAFDDTRDVRFDGFPGVSVYIRAVALDMHETLKAAA